MQIPNTRGQTGPTLVLALSLVLIPTFNPTFIITLALIVTITLALTPQLRKMMWSDEYHRLVAGRYGDLNALHAAVRTCMGSAFDPESDEMVREDV